jgi:hypothetical protein
VLLGQDRYDDEVVTGSRLNPQPSSTVGADDGSSPCRSRDPPRTRRCGLWGLGDAAGHRLVRGIYVRGIYDCNQRSRQRLRVGRRVRATAQRDTSLATMTWSKGPDLPTKRLGLASAVADGRRYVIGGGRAAGLSVSDVVEIYSMTWSATVPR